MSSYISFKKKITSCKQIRLTPFVFAEAALIADVDPDVDDNRRS